jgi:hypothetical protein
MQRMSQRSSFRDPMLWPDGLLAGSFQFFDVFSSEFFQGFMKKIYILKKNVSIS